MAEPGWRAAIRRLEAQHEAVTSTAAGFRPPLPTPPVLQLESPPQQQEHGQGTLRQPGRAQGRSPPPLPPFGLGVADVDCSLWYFIL